MVRLSIRWSASAGSRPARRMIGVARFYRVVRSAKAFLGLQAGQGEPPGCDRDVHAREWPPARLTRGRRPLGVSRDRACNVVSDTMHETVTERLALQLVRQPARERHRVDQAAQWRGVSCRQSLSSLLAPTKR